MRRLIIFTLVLIMLNSYNVTGFSKGDRVGSFFVKNDGGHFYAIHNYDVYYFDLTYSQYPDIDSSWVSILSSDLDYAIIDEINLDDIVDNSKYIVKNIDVHPNGTLYLLLGSGGFPGSPPYRIIGIETVNGSVVYDTVTKFDSPKGNVKELLVTENWFAIMMNEDENQVRFYDHAGYEIKTLELAPKGIADDRGSLLRTMAFDGEGLWLATEVGNSYRTDNEAVFYRFNLSTGIQDMVLNNNPDAPKAMEYVDGEIVYVTTDRVDDGTINTLEATVRTADSESAKSTTTPEEELNYPLLFSLLSGFVIFMINKSKKRQLD